MSYDRLTSAYRVAGKAAVGLAVGIDVNRLFLDEDDVPGITFLETDTDGPIAVHRQLAHMTIAGPAAELIYSGDVERNRLPAFLQFSFDLEYASDALAGSELRTYRKAIMGFAELSRGRLHRVGGAEAYSASVIDRTLRIIDERWPAVEVLAEHLDDVGRVGRVAIHSIQSRALEGERNVSR